MRIVILLALTIALTGCSLSAKMGRYEARFTDQNGVDYQVFNKRGALLQIEKPDGTKILADDRGHPEQPGILSQAATLLLLKATD